VIERTRVCGSERLRKRERESIGGGMDKGKKFGIYYVKKFVLEEIVFIYEIC
jgi:hypothetical protein